MITAAKGLRIFLHHLSKASWTFTFVNLLSMDFKDVSTIWILCTNFKKNAALTRMPYTWKNCITVLFLSWVLSACTDGNRSSTPKSVQDEQTPLKIDYISFYIASDTLPLPDRKKAIAMEDSILVKRRDSESWPMHFFFQAKLKFWDNEPEAGFLMLDSMKVTEPSSDIYFLKHWATLEHETNRNSVVEATVMKEIQELLQKAELAKSRVTFHFYDVAAKAFYQNRNEKTALSYVAKYFESHPYNWHPVVKQRYYDVSFLLASRMADYEKMEKYNELARQLALSSKNNTALARTYDNEAQMYARRGLFSKSLEYSKLYVSILEQNNNIHDVAYNNLALSFANSGQLDSAITYYKKAIELNKIKMPEKPRYLLYKGLSEAYLQKGDYRKAFEALDFGNKLEIKSIKEIEATNIAEIESKYQTEKKDRNILELNNKNQHSENIIRQQKWMLFTGLALAIGVLAIVYTMYQQKSLKQKNKLLHSDNNRLKLEHKLLQTQLNPHFVFNSIANLQGLIATGDTSQSVLYLSSFSQLLRDILEQSRKDFIGLDEEIESLENYLHLQQMRYPNLFDYQIAIDKHLDLEEIVIPPMLLQPFVENAIEHGFRNLTYKGKLNIQFELTEKALSITIDDNGNGMSNPKPKGQKKKSLAYEILKERLQLLYRFSNQEAYFEVTEKNVLGEKGVKVKISIPKL
ncbi:TPR repeat-containing protein [Sphingobacterium nematocida]|uniref:TPR repeat-containing protein n=1 Tax=Sphingobacterium nematocida TaxID=1513896 RepID=A0A1T5AXK6_9SPHI|nr:histidine kinase [Sphingobacterium nematocida]SKB39738.1 TPR repeat-containing protein [Sphingobacterium nematocida]